MKRLILLLALLSFAQWGYSQWMPCLYDVAVQQMDKQYPGYRAQSQAAIKAAVERYRQQRNPTDEIFTIPVVVHVVWKEEAENISDERIETQMRVLNEAYRRQNADTVNTRPVFQPVVGDAGIEFVLSDIIRVQTDTTFQPEISLLGGSTLPDHVKISAAGGSDAVDHKNFLNIWVCAIQPIELLGTENPMLGYAYPPAGLDNWPAGTDPPSPELEGVVVDYRTVGENLSYEIPQIGEIPILGRTPVHEVGHYLGLRHTSGDGALSTLGVPDCEADDGVADTPNQGLQSQFNCDPMQNTCEDASNDLPDMIENYMDYSLENCQNSFTKGQIEIMRAVLMDQRAELPLNTTNTTAAENLKTALLYPNPSKGIFTVEFSAGAQQNYTFSVLDAYGRLVQPPLPGQPQVEIDLSDQPVGMYYLQLRMEDGRVYSRKLIRQ